MQWLMVMSLASARPHHNKYFQFPVHGKFCMRTEKAAGGWGWGDWLVAGEGGGQLAARSWWTQWRLRCRQPATAATWPEDGGHNKQQGSNASRAASADLRWLMALVHGDVYSAGGMCSVEMSSNLREVAQCPSNGCMGMFKRG